jgi:hypothetical protein
MSTITLKEKAQQILDEKTTKIIPGNFSEDLQIFDVVGSMDDIENGSSIEGTPTYDSVNGKVVLTNNNTDTILRSGAAIKANQAQVASTINLTANKIKKDVTILGVTGNVEELNGEVKTVTPTTSEQIITPSSGKNAITEVTVNPVTSSIDANITAGNIKAGTTILGVTGNVEELKGETKTVTPTTNQQVIAPSSGKNAITEVTVEAIQTETKTVKSTTNQQTITPTSGKFINEITVDPIVLETKTVTPTTNQQVINTSSGKDGISSITVNAVTNTIDNNIQANNIKSGVSILGVTGNVVELNGTTLNANLSNINQSIEPQSPYNGFTVVNIPAVTASVDSNIAANNIKTGVNILGITGNYEGLNTSDANAIAQDIRIGKSAYVNGVKVNGSLAEITNSTGYVYGDIPNKIKITQFQFSLTNNVPVTGIVSSPNITISANLSDVVNVANVTADKIKSGESILGVVGNYSGTDTSDANAVALDIVQDKTAYVQGQKVTGSVPQIKSGQTTYGNGNSATATNFGVDVTAEIGSVVLLRPGAYFETTVLNNTLATAINLTADKIKSGVNILGVAGNYSGLNTQDATATAEDIMINKTAYVNGAKVVGTLNTLNITEYNNAMNTINNILGV